MLKFCAYILYNLLWVESHEVSPEVVYPNSLYQRDAWLSTQMKRTQFKYGIGHWCGYYAAFFYHQTRLQVYFLAGFSIRGEQWQSQLDQAFGRQLSIMKSDKSFALPWYFRRWKYLLFPYFWRTGSCQYNSTTLMLFQDLNFAGTAWQWSAWRLQRRSIPSKPGTGWTWYRRWRGWYGYVT